MELPEDRLGGDTLNSRKSGRHPRDVGPQAMAGFPIPCQLPHSLGPEKGQNEKHQPRAGGEDKTSHCVVAQHPTSGFKHP